MNSLILDGQPDAGRLTTTLLDHYAAALPAGGAIWRLAAREFSFSSNLAQD